jgi:hypothetical protein
MVFKTPEQKCNDIVIGHSLPALLYSYLNDYPIIINKQLIDNSFDFCHPDLSLGAIGFNNKSSHLRAAEGSHEVGRSKAEVKSELLLCLSLSGLVMNSETLSSTKIMKGEINYFTKSRKYSSTYTTAHIFNADNVNGVNIKKHNISYDVYDNIHIRSSNKNDIEYISTDDNFVSQIYIYPSKRNGTRQEDRDIICKSTLTREQLDSFDYSDTICRMKVATKMKDCGFTGSKVGITKRNSSEQYWRELSLVSAERNVYEKCLLSCEDNGENILINNSTAQQIIDQHGENVGLAKKINSALRQEEAAPY